MSNTLINPYRAGYRSIALSRLDWGSRSFEEVTSTPVDDVDDTLGEVIWDKERHLYVLVAGHEHVKWLLENNGERHRYWFHFLRERSPSPAHV